MSEERTGAPVEKKKSGFVLSLVGFIMGLVAIGDALSCYAIFPLLEAEKDMYRDKYSGTNTKLVFDDSMTMLWGKILAIFSVLVALVGMILSIVGLAKFSKSKKDGAPNKAALAFGIIGLLLGLAGIIVGIVMFRLF